MKIKKHKGFTLIEVLIGFVLLSFIIMMVGTVVTSGYFLATKIHELPNAYYAAQNEAESTMDKVSKDVKMWYRYTNEINQIPAEDTSGKKEDLIIKRDEVAESLEPYKMESYSLFGKTIEIYRVDVDYTDAKTGTKHVIHAGVVNAETLERLKPIINNVTIIPKGKTNSPEDLYFTAGTEIKANVDLSETNDDYLLMYQYQWHIGFGGYHTVEYEGGRPSEDNRNVYTNFPVSYTPIIGEKSDTITIKEEYYGCQLVCVVTPLSKNGAMGASKVSKPLYLSGLPELSSGTYTMHIDVSATPFKYSSDETVILGENGIPDRLESRGSTANDLGISVYSGIPKVNLDGEPTDSDTSIALNGGDGIYTRFVSFAGNSDSMISNERLPAGTVFAVAKNNELTDVNFITVGGKSIGFDGSGNTGWQIIEDRWTNRGYLELGRANVDVAELITVSGATPEELSEIWDYLLVKYNIVQDNPYTTPTWP